MREGIWHGDCRGGGCISSLSVLAPFSGVSEFGTGHVEKALLVSIGGQGQESGVVFCSTHSVSASGSIMVDRRSQGVTPHGICSNTYEARHG